MVASTPQFLSILLSRDEGNKKQNHKAGRRSLWLLSQFCMYLHIVAGLKIVFSYHFFPLHFGGRITWVLMSRKQKRYFFWYIFIVVFSMCLGKTDPTFLLFAIYFHPTSTNSIIYDFSSPLIRCSVILDWINQHSVDLITHMEWCLISGSQHCNDSVGIFWFAFFFFSIFKRKFEITILLRFSDLFCKLNLSHFCLGNREHIHFL
jgi:hypothetical protein